MKDPKENLDLSKKLDLAGVADMMAHLIWVPALYRTFCTSLKEEHFRTDAEQDETCFRSVWGALKQYYSQEGTTSPPNRAKFEMYLREYLRKAPMDGVEEILFGDDPRACLMANLFDPDRGNLSYSTGEPLLKQFLMDRAISNEITLCSNDMKRFSGYVDMKTADKLRDMAERATRIEALSAEMAIEPLAPEASYFDKAKRQKKIPSGIAWIDDRIGDGQRYGDVNGLIGPTGAGKTTLGSQIFVGNVVGAFNEAQNHGEDRICIFYTYEQNAFDLQCKIFSNAFDIARKSISEDSYLDGLSRGTPDHPLKDYERSATFGGMSEFERYNRKRKIISKYGFIRNMSGVADVCDDAQARSVKMNKGTGGIQELVNDLHYMRDREGRGIRAVFIDYLGLVMEREHATSSDPKVMYYALKRFGDEVRQRVAGEFNCVVWLLHQMSGAANKTKPTTPLTHADSEGCRSLANNMANCLCLGTKDNGYNGGGSCLYLTFSKTRHSGESGFDKTHLILQHNPLFARLDNVTDAYEADRGRGCFFPKNEGHYN